MNCFEHSDTTAIGICKSCNKAVCISCAIDTGEGLACSEKCKKEVLEINQVINRNKNIYGIGDNAEKHIIPSGVMVYLFFTVIFLGWSAFDYILYSKINTYLIVMGAAFLGMGIIVYRRTKKMNITC